MKHANADLYPLFQPLTKPMYILRMAATKRGRFTWGREARLKYALQWREALHECLTATDTFIRNEQRKAP